jgi:hypothetical protein
MRQKADSQPTLCGANIGIIDLGHDRRIRHQARVSRVSRDRPGGEAASRSRGPLQLHQLARLRHHEIARDRSGAIDEHDAERENPRRKDEDQP